MIYVLGDSHSTIIAHILLNRKVNTIRCGFADNPPLLYTLANKGINRVINSEIHKNIFESLKKNDKVFISAGEVDCRCHILKHDPKLIKYEITIEEMVDKYVLNLSILKQEKNIDIYAISVPPPITWKYNNNSWPVLGKPEERLKCVNHMNECLKNSCKKYNINFVNINKPFMDDKGYLVKNLSDGWTHINYRDIKNLDIIWNNYLKDIF
jgi:hypothetical protein